ncbi:MAG TPA: ferritin-like domain-containing protein [Abditibacterium sp.]|jgi:hypothetical protein
MIEFEKLQRDPVSRRAFLQRMSAAGLGVAAISLLNGCGGGGSSNNNSGGGQFPIRALPGTNDNVKVLNYALTLEILEADLYRQALNYASGFPLTRELSAAGDYSLQVSSGGVNAAAGFAYLRDFAFVEAAHRDFLTVTIQTLNETPVVRNAKGYQFASVPANNLRAILEGILPLEETGVRAYLGAAPFFVNFNTDLTKTLIQAAVGIYSTEARHSAAIQYILGKDSGPNGSEPGVPTNSRVTLRGVGALPYSDKGQGDTFEYFSTPNQVVNAIQPLIVK